MHLTPVLPQLLQGPAGRRAIAHGHHLVTGFEYRKRRQPHLRRDRRPRDQHSLPVHTVSSRSGSGSLSWLRKQEAFAVSPLLLDDGCSGRAHPSPLRDALRPAGRRRRGCSAHRLAGCRRHLVAQVAGRRHIGCVHMVGWCWGCYWDLIPRRRLANSVMPFRQLLSSLSHCRDSQTLTLPGLGLQWRWLLLTCMCMRCVGVGTGTCAV